MRKKLSTLVLLMVAVGSFFLYKNFQQNIREKIANTASATSPQTNTTPPSAQETHQEQQALLDVPINSTKNVYRTFLENHPYYKGRPYTMQEIKAMPKKDRPDLAMEYEFLKTFDPHTFSIPSERLWEARRITREKLNRQSKDKAGIIGAFWTERGPNNVGGRTRALMYDPTDATKKKVWAGSVAGGLWYNNDITSANTSWQRVDDFWSNMAISAIAYAPNAISTFYVGTGEGFGNTDAVRGGGVWKSTDAGKTWNALPNTTPTATTEFRFIQKIIVNSIGDVFVATRVSGATGGVFRSKNGGNTWTKIYSNSVADMEMAKNGDLYVGTFNGGLERLTDPSNSSTWTNIKPTTVTGGARVEIAIAASTGTATNNTSLYVMAGDGSNIAWFVKSTDGGTTWTNCVVPLYLNGNCTQSTTQFTRSQSWYDLIMQVRPDNPNIILVGGVDVHGSSDGGQSWTPLSYWTGNCQSYVHADIHAIEFNPNNFDSVIVGSDGGVSYSPNVGSGSGAFENRVKDYNVTQFYACAMTNQANSNIYLAGAQDNGTNRFSQSGIGASTEPTGGDGAFCFIDQDNPNIAISSYVYNVYYRSTNAGVGFSTMVNNQSTSQGFFINPADYDNDENILYSSGATNELKRIKNIETTPSSQENVAVSLGSGRATTIRADAYSTGRLFVGTSFGEVYRVDNAHTDSPTSNMIGSFGSGFVSCVDVGANDNELVVTLSNYGIASVYYTNDGGTSWTSKDQAEHGLPDMPIRWVLFNPNDYKQVILATELGVWSTQDITASNPAWEPTNAGLANVRCDMLQYRTSDKQVAIATHARGLYTSNIFASPVLTAVSFSPTNNASAVPIGTSLKMTFNNNVTKGTGNISIKRVLDNVTFETISVSSNQVSIVDATVTIIPTNNLVENTAYYIEVTNGAFLNINNLPSTAIAGNNTWRFTTVDLSAPFVSSFTPAHNTANFSMTGNLVIQFSENVKKGSGNITLRKVTDNSAVEVIAVTDAKITVNNATVTINPTEDLLSATDYYVELASGAIQDLVGNNFVGFSGNTTWRFRTETDLTSPQLITLSPTNNSINFPGANNLVMTFNENLQKGASGTLVIRKLSDASAVETIDVSSNAITVAGKVVTINPVDELPYNTDLYVEVTSGFVKDLAGNSMVAITGSTIWKFKTDFSTSLYSPNVAEGIQIYPNPALKQVTLEVSKELALPDAGLKMMDNKGNILWERKANSTEKQLIELGNLPAGKYWLEINTKQGKAIKPIVKQ